MRIFESLAQVEVYNEHTLIRRLITGTTSIHLKVFLDSFMPDLVLSQELQDSARLSEPTIALDLF